MTIYVANLNHDSVESDLTTLFSKFGSIVSVRIIKDPYSGQSKGFGFIDMPDDASANAAISKLHETEFMGRNIVVNKAKPRSTDKRRPESSNRRSYNSFDSNKNYNY